MQEPKDLFTEMGKMAAETHFKTLSTKITDKEKEELAQRLQLLLIGILLFVGADALKVLLRTNFGSRAISLLRIGIASLCLFLWGIICIGLAIFLTDQKTINFFVRNGGQSVLIFTGLFYVILSISVFIIGLKERMMSKTSDSHPYFGGNSIILKKFIERSVNVTAVHIVIEPLFAFAAGLFLGSINVMLGLPIIACAVSLFVYQVYEQIFLSTDQVYKTLQENGAQRKKNFSEVS